MKLPTPFRTFLWHKDVCCWRNHFADIISRSVTLECFTAAIASIFYLWLPFSSPGYFGVGMAVGATCQKCPCGSSTQATGTTSAADCNGKSWPLLRSLTAQ